MPNDFEKLKQDVESLMSDRGQLRLSQDEESRNVLREVLRDVLPEVILDTVWNNYFYYFSTFEGEDGWDVTSDAALPIQGSGLTLQTTAVADNRSNAFKQVRFQKVMSFDERSRFRTLFLLDIDTAASNIDYSLSVGTGIPTPLSNRYGFRLEENEMYGICSDGSSESKIKLFETNADQGNGNETFPRLLEARLIPGEKVVFWASEEGGSELIERGVLETNLPSGNDEISIAFDLYTRTTTAKRAFVDFAEYIQVRP